MPKIENFTSYFKIDNRRYNKNTLNWEPFGDLIRVYHFTSPNIITEAGYTEWTDSNDNTYASLSELSDALDFAFYTNAASSGFVSESNSSTTPLNSSSIYTGSWTGS